MANGSALRMDKEQSQVTERILQLTLEIIYLLTGEDFTIMRKPKDDVTKTQFSPASEALGFSKLPPPSIISRRHNGKKILEITNKIIELLNEEWEYLEGQKDLYKDIRMEEQQPLRDVKREQLETFGSLGKVEIKAEVKMENKCWAEANKYQSVIKEPQSRSVFVPNPKLITMNTEDHIQANDRSSKETEWMFVTLKEEKEEFDEDSEAPEEFEDSVEGKAASAESDDERDDTEEEDLQNVYIPKDGTINVGDKLLMKTCKVCGESLTDRNPDSSENVKCLKCSSFDSIPVESKSWSTSIREEFLRVPKMSNIDTETIVIDDHVIGKKVIYMGQPGDHKPLPGEKVLACEVCGRYFAQQGALDIHRRIHTGEKPFICMKCGKGFRSKGNLVSHQTVHTDDKQFQCPVCEKFFKRSLGLVEHMRLHTGEKPFTCHDCGKCFSQRSAFSTHQKIHADGKVFTCFDCGRCFKTKADLRTHELVHLGDKPFQCTECGEGFTRRANLLRHQRSHSGVKPFSCPDCGKTFTRKLGLLKHERLHIREEQQARFQASVAFAAAQASM